MITTSSSLRRRVVSPARPRPPWSVELIAPLRAVAAAAASADVRYPFACAMEGHHEWQKQWRIRPNDRPM